MAMTLVDHLEELRRRLFFCVGAVVLGAFVAFVFHAPILEFLLSPLPSQANALVGHGGKLQIAVTADNYFTFVAYFLLAFGLTFELPLVLTGLVVMGIVSPDSLRTHRASLLVGVWTASCLITPGADADTPLLLGATFTVLFFVSVGLFV